MVAKLPVWMRWWVGAALAACLIALSSPARALDAPPLERRVTDTGALLSAEAREQLEQRLAAYERETGHQFALLTIPSLQGDVLEDYAIRAAERWKLGSKERDDGLLVVIAKQDRKVRIEVGHGLEGAVTDAFSARVIRNVMTPAFRAGDFQSGIEKGFDALMKQASGEAVDPAVLAPAARPARRAPPSGGLPLGLVVVFFVLPALLALFSRGGGRRGRGGFFVGGLPLGWGVGSGGRRGGGFGGGGFGGGGFGGGGGGSFGGGGSSGSW